MHTTRFKKKILRLKFAQQKSDEILNFAIFLEEDNPNSFFSFTVSLDLSMLTFICKIDLPTAFSTEFGAMCNNDIFLSFFAEVCLCSHI